MMHCSNNAAWQNAQAALSAVQNTAVKSAASTTANNNQPYVSLAHDVSQSQPWSHYHG